MFNSGINTGANTKTSTGGLFAKIKAFEKQNQKQQTVKEILQKKCEHTEQLVKKSFGNDNASREACMQALTEISLIKLIAAENVKENITLLEKQMINEISKGLNPKQHTITKDRYCKHIIVSREIFVAAYKLEKHLKQKEYT
ncbi:MAG: hypothetical protein LBU68_02475 [Rickettsiales bacterium]|jgi:hypothetical protein|nr:hypothetical protein [Rickettsiales bacterium]